MAVKHQITEADLKSIPPGFPTPFLEYKFHPSRGWAFDLAWPSRKVALEIEGGIFGRGRRCPTCGMTRRGAHSSVTGILRDMEKYNAAAELNWLVLRYRPGAKGWALSRVDWDQVARALATQDEVGKRS